MLVPGNGAVGAGGLGLPEVQVAGAGFTVHVYGVSLHGGVITAVLVGWVNAFHIIYSTRQCFGFFGGFAWSHFKG